MSDSVQFVEFFGERFAIPARMNQRLVIKFQRMAAEDADTESSDPEKAKEAAIMLDKIVEQSVRPEDRQRFEDVCDREMPNDEELMGFVARILGAVAQRPTGRPSDSSDGPTSTEQKSGSEPASPQEPSLRIVRELEAQGRADKAEFVAMAMRERSAS